LLRGEKIATTRAHDFSKRLRLRLCMSLVIARLLPNRLYPYGVFRTEAPEGLTATRMDLDSRNMDFGFWI
jgi:hypothetical protein